MQGIMDDSPLDPVTQRRIRKIRRLRQPVKPPPLQQNSKKTVKIFIAALLLSMVVFFISSNQYLVNEFKNLALNQYQLYLHGRIDYCKEHFDHKRIIKTIREQIINQDAPLNRIEAAFLEHEKVTALAMLGPQGVGKTMTLNIIQNQFQWHLNIQQLVWSSFDSQQSRDKSLNGLVDSLSTCGQNGIFIDNIPSPSLPIIKTFHKKLLDRCNENQMKCIIIYVFQFDTWPTDKFEFDGVKLVKFRSFETKDLLDCLAAESTRLKIELTQEQRDDLLDSIDVERNGCKTVAAKITRYAPK